MRLRKNVSPDKNPGPLIEWALIPEEKTFMKYVDIDGHKVDARIADRFYNDSDGSRVTDEQWDETKRRIETNGEGVDIPKSTTLPEGDIFAVRPEW